jgi:hypothetical protein
MYSATLATVTWTELTHTHDAAPARAAESLPLDHAAALVLDGFAVWLFPSTELHAAVETERARRAAKSQQVAS